MKISKNPFSALFPCTIVMVSSVDTKGKPNIITLAWVGTVCSTPPMVGIAINPLRYSYQLIDESKQFVVNIPTKNNLKEIDFCGVTSGRDTDKFSITGLTPEAAEKVRPPLIRECPVNLECIVKEKLMLGSHHLFIGEVVSVHVEKDILNENDRIDPTKISPIVYIQREYWSLNQKIGIHGFSKQE